MWYSLVLNSYVGLDGTGVPVTDVTAVSPEAQEWAVDMVWRHPSCSASLLIL